MKFIMNKKFRIIQDFLSAFILTILIIMLLAINTFHDSEHFIDTAILNDMVSEQADMIYEYCIEPNAFNFKFSDFSEIFDNTNFLDPNYQFVLKTDINSFQSMPDGALQNNYYRYVDTHFYTIYDTFNRRDINVYIESYISTKYNEQGHIYNFYKKFEAIDNYFPPIVIVFAILLILLIINVIGTIINHVDKSFSAFYKNFMDNIYYEIPLIIFLFLLCANNYIDILQFSFTNYFIIFMKLYLLIIIGIVLLKTTISRLFSKIFLKKVLVFRAVWLITKFIKQILLNLNGRFRGIVILSAFMAIEIALMIGIYYEGEPFCLIWFAIKIIQITLLIHYFSNLCKINTAAKDMQTGATNVKVDTKYMYGVVRENAEYMNNISIGLDKAVEEKIKSEQLKTELITNVSHDLKTPLTSIINYVDLMKKETTGNDKISEYLEVLDKQSQRLKTLTENVIEASKAATGNMLVNIEEVNINEILSQALGEYENKFKELNIITIQKSDTIPAIVKADGQLLWRVLDNLFSNVCKYTLEGTRVYIDITDTSDYQIISIKNISKYQLNISSEELMGRFVRGDSSRSTSGNGLGLSIAQSFMTLQEGKLELNINGDLFVANIYLQKDSRA